MCLYYLFLIRMLGIFLNQKYFSYVNGEFTQRKCDGNVTEMWWSFTFEM